MDHVQSVRSAKPKASSIQLYNKAQKRAPAPTCSQQIEDEQNMTTRRAHPTFYEWRCEKLTSESLQQAFFGGGHKCVNLHNGKPCHADLWGDAHTGLEALRSQRALQESLTHVALWDAQTRAITIHDSSAFAEGEWVLPALKEGKNRRDLIFKHLLLSNPQAASKGKLVLLIGSRQVCPQVFCDNWCVSRAQLDRYIKLIKEGYRDISDTKASSGQPVVPRETRKRDFVITWFIQYAAEVTEKLPDFDKLLLPRMLWKDLHAQYCNDMREAGYAADACCQDYFRQTFKDAEELSHMDMTTFKRNFQKCKICVRLTAAVTKALKGHDAMQAQQAKGARLTHYMLARSDKLHYWRQRWEVGA